MAILTGWSKSGGSTESYINLTNALNERGVNTILLGPHDWHLDRCKGGILRERTHNLKSRNIIWHYLIYPENQNGKLWKDSNFILSSHETNLKRVFMDYKPQIINSIFDHFHFVSESQKQYHLNHCPIDGVDLDSISVIPNILDPKLVKVDRSHTKKIGGVIGSVDWNKQTHVSIMNALKDGCEIVRVFGRMDTSDPYFNKYLRGLFESPKVLYHGIIDDKNKMYSSISDVYHYSLKESWGYIKAECEFLGIPFHSNNNDILDLKTTDEIVDMWRDILV